MDEKKLLDEMLQIGTALLKMSSSQSNAPVQRIIIG
jgi:hypothetical protein